MIKIDDLDLTILSELSDNSRIPIPKLSEKIKVNSSVVYARIRRLQKKNLIQRYTIDINDYELGYQVKALIGINMDSKKRNNVIDKLFEIEGIREVAEVTGRFDILVTIYTRSLDSLHEIVSDSIGKIEGVLSSESFIEMKTRQKSMPYMALK